MEADEVPNRPETATLLSGGIQVAVEWAGPTGLTDIDTWPEDLDDAECIAGHYRSKGLTANIITRQTYHTEWQKLDEHRKTDTKR